MTENFERFLRNSIAIEFGFEGVPVRILVRDNKTQYARKGLTSLNPNTKAILERMKLHKLKMKNVTHRRRLAGNRFLYRT